MMELVNNPVAEQETLDQLKGILIKSRNDQKSSPPAIAQALYMYNRYGEESPLLEATTQEILETDLNELTSLPSNLLNYRQTIAYTGSMPLEDLVEVLRRSYPIADDSKKRQSLDYELLDR